MRFELFLNVSSSTEAIKFYVEELGLFRVAIDYGMHPFKWNFFQAVLAFERGRVHHMKNFDHYAAATRLADMLRGEGLDEWAQEIDGGMEEGATGTEIFMILRARLAVFLLSGQGSPEAVASAAELSSHLNASLS